MKQLNKPRTSKIIVHEPTKSYSNEFSRKDSHRVQPNSKSKQLSQVITSNVIDCNILPTSVYSNEVLINNSPRRQPLDEFKGKFTRKYQISFKDYQTQSFPQISFIPKGLVLELVNYWQKANKKKRQEWSYLLDCIRLLSASHLNKFSNNELGEKVYQCLHDTKKFLKESKKLSSNNANNETESVLYAPFYTENVQTIKMSKRLPKLTFNEQSKLKPEEEILGKIQAIKTEDIEVVVDEEFEKLETESCDITFDELEVMDKASHSTDHIMKKPEEIDRSYLGDKVMLVNDIKLDKPVISSPVLKVIGKRDMLIFPAKNNITEITSNFYDRFQSISKAKDLGLIKETNKCLRVDEDVNTCVKAISSCNENMKPEILINAAVLCPSNENVGQKNLHYEHNIDSVQKYTGNQFKEHTLTLEECIQAIREEESLICPDLENSCQISESINSNNDSSMMANINENKETKESSQGHQYMELECHVKNPNTMIVEAFQAGKIDDISVDSSLMIKESTNLDLVEEKGIQCLKYDNGDHALIEEDINEESSITVTKEKSEESCNVETDCQMTMANNLEQESPILNKNCIDGLNLGDNCNIIKSNNIFGESFVKIKDDKKASFTIKNQELLNICDGGPINSNDFITESSINVEIERIVNDNDKIQEVCENNDGAQTLQLQEVLEEPAIIVKEDASNDPVIEKSSHERLEKGEMLQAMNLKNIDAESIVRKEKFTAINNEKVNLGNFKLITDGDNSSVLNSNIIDKKEDSLLSFRKEMNGKKYFNVEVSSTNSDTINCKTNEYIQVSEESAIIIKENSTNDHINEKSSQKNFRNDHDEIIKEVKNEKVSLDHAKFIKDIDNIPKLNINYFNTPSFIKKKENSNLGCLEEMDCKKYINNEDKCQVPCTKSCGNNPSSTPHNDQNSPDSNLKLETSSDVEIHRTKINDECQVLSNIKDCFPFESTKTSELNLCSPIAEDKIVKPNPNDTKKNLFNDSTPDVTMTDVELSLEPKMFAQVSSKQEKHDELLIKSEVNEDEKVKRYLNNDSYQMEILNKTNVRLEEVTRNEAKENIRQKLFGISHDMNKNVNFPKILTDAETSSNINLICNLKNQHFVSDCKISHVMETKEKFARSSNHVEIDIANQNKGNEKQECFEIDSNGQLLNIHDVNFKTCLVPLTQESLLKQVKSEECAQNDQDQVSKDNDLGGIASSFVLMKTSSPRINDEICGQELLNGHDSCLMKPDINTFQDFSKNDPNVCSNDKKHIHSLKRLARCKKKYANMKSKLLVMSTIRKNIVQALHNCRAELFEAYEEDMSKIHLAVQLEDQLKVSKYELSIMKNNIQKLNLEKIDIMKSLIEKSKKIIFLEDKVNELLKVIEELKDKKPELVTMIGGQFTPEVNDVFKQLLACNVPIEKIPNLIRCTVENLTGLVVTELPFDSFLTEVEKDKPLPLKSSKIVKDDLKKDKDKETLMKSKDCKKIELRTKEFNVCQSIERTKPISLASRYAKYADGKDRDQCSRLKITKNFVTSQRKKRFDAMKSSTELKNDEHQNNNVFSYKIKNVKGPFEGQNKKLASNKLIDKSIDHKFKEKAAKTYSSQMTKPECKNYPNEERGQLGLVPKTKDERHKSTADNKSNKKLGKNPEDTKEERQNHSSKKSKDSELAIAAKLDNDKRKRPQRTTANCFEYKLLNNGIYDRKREKESDNENILTNEPVYKKSAVKELVVQRNEVKNKVHKKSDTKDNGKRKRSVKSIPEVLIKTDDTSDSDSFKQSKRKKTKHLESNTSKSKQNILSNLCIDDDNITMEEDGTIVIGSLAKLFGL